VVLLRCPSRSLARIHPVVAMGALVVGRGGGGWATQTRDVESCSELGDLGFGGFGGAVFVYSQS